MKMHVNVCKHVASAKSSTVKWNYRQWNAILAVFVSVCVCLQDTLYSMSLLDWTSGWLPQCHKDMWSLVHRLVKMLLISVFSCSCLQLCIDSKAHWVLVVKCQTTTAPYQKCFQNFRHSWEARTFQAVQICQTHQFILFPQCKQWKIGNILRTRVCADGAACVYIWTLPLCFTVFPCLHRAVYQKNLTMRMSKRDNPEPNSNSIENWVISVSLLTTTPASQSI